MKYINNRDFLISVQEWLDIIIGDLKKASRFNTASHYLRTAASFNNCMSWQRVYFTQVDEQLLLEYNRYLTMRGVTRNTVSFYMRTLRAAYNKAVRMGYAKPTNAFNAVYTGVDKTRKRAIDENAIKRLYELDLHNDPKMALARDMFLFSYYTRGMSFIDMAYLKWNSLKNGYISYHRHKTGQLLCIKLEPCMLDIANRYSSDTEYVFPVINTDMPHESHSQYVAGLALYNRRLKTLGRIIGLSLPLTSYMSRHSWANIAQNYRIPISVISAGMGHTSEMTTRIYLQELNNSWIDEANSKMLAQFNPTDM